MSSHARQCSTCSTMVDAEAMFCPECGALGDPAGPAASSCPSCSRAVGPDERFCGWCGAAQHTGEGPGRPQGGRSRHDDLTDAEVTLGKYLPAVGPMGHGPARDGAPRETTPTWGATGGSDAGPGGGSPRGASPGGPTPRGGTKLTPALLLVAGLAVIALVTSVVVLATGGDDDRVLSAADDPVVTPTSPTAPRSDPTREPAQRTTPTPTEPSAADLPGIGLQRRDLECTDDNSYVVVLATGTVNDEDDVVAKLENAASLYGGTYYSAPSSSCENAFKQASPDGIAYQAYLGEFSTFGTACTAQYQTRPGTFIKNLRLDAALDGSSFCFCRKRPAAQPVLGFGATQPFLVSDVQQVLDLEGFNEERIIDGVFTSALQAQLEAYQRARQVTVSGVVDEPTWAALRTDAECDGA